LADGKTMLAGTATGELLLWQHGRCAAVIRANRQQPIFALHASEAGVFAAGRGGRLFCWPGLRAPPLRLADAVVLSLAAHLGGAADGAGRPLALLRGEPPCVRSLAILRGPEGALRLGLATRGGELWELSLPLALESGGRLAPPSLLVQGHSVGFGVNGGGSLSEASALATHPYDGTVFATGGDDGTVRLWSVDARRMLAMRLLGGRVTALAFSCDGAHLAAGTDGGAILVLLASTLADAESVTLDGEGVACLAYSPDDALLAAGTGSGRVALLRPRDAYATLRTLAAAAAPILSIDWSQDSDMLQVSSAKCELSYWAPSEGHRLVPAANNDHAAKLATVRWASFSSPLGWEAAGVLPKLSDGSDVASAHRSPDGTLLATSDDFRKVCLGFILFYFKAVLWEYNHPFIAIRPPLARRDAARNLGRLSNGIISLQSCIVSLENCIVSLRSCIVGVYHLFIAIRPPLARRDAARDLGRLSKGIILLESCIGSLQSCIVGV